MCVCVCVFFPFILDIKFVGRTSRGHTGGRSHRISHPLSFCGNKGGIVHVKPNTTCVLCTHGVFTLLSANEQVIITLAL